MAQLNVGLDAADKARFDAFAAAEGLASGTLGRSVILEYLKAREQGRAMFEPVEPPIDADTAVTLAMKIEQISIDLDRILRSADRREKKLLEAFHATEEANRNALGRLGDELTKRFAEGATPFSEMLADHGRGVARLHREVLAASRKPEWMGDLTARLNTIETAAKQPSTVNRFELATNWSMSARELCAAAVVGLITATLLIILVARTFPDSWIATPMAQAMYGSADRGICELWKERDHIDRCPRFVPKTEGKAQ